MSCYDAVSVLLAVLGSVTLLSFSVSSASCMDSPDSEMVLYLMLRSVDRFYQQHSRYPGENPTLPQTWVRSTKRHQWDAGGIYLVILIGYAFSRGV